jgi:polysaccharide pyruvyl transferase WcaK-like protein
MSSLDAKVIAVFGSYNRQSVGDKAILISLIDLLFRVSNTPLKIMVICFDAAAIEQEIKWYWWAQHVSAVSIFSSRIQETIPGNLSSARGALRRMPKWLLTSCSILKFILRHPRKLATGADLLIIGGGNLFMDLFLNWPIRPFAIARQFKRNNVPIVIAGVGAYPIKTRFGNVLLKSVARSAAKVFVRDRETLRFFKDTCRVPAKIKPDLAFSLPVINRCADPVSLSRILAVNVAPVFGPNWPYSNNVKYKIYLDLMADGLYKFVSKQGKGWNLSFVDTNYPTDREGTIGVIQRLIEKGIEQSRIKYSDHLLSAQEIIQEFRVAKVAIVTRLHAGIMSLVAGCPVVGVAYQPKVRDVFKNIGLGENIVNIDALEKLESHLSRFEGAKQKYILSNHFLVALDEMNQGMVREALACMS